MRNRQYLYILAAVLLVSTAVFAQGQFSAMTGRITMDGNPLPGVTVTATSPSLQGTRTTISDVNGIYNLGALPSGQYTVRFDMEGMQTVTRAVPVALAQTAHADAVMTLSAIAEAITVTATAPAVLENSEVQTNYSQQLVNDLPLGRTVTAVALMAPGTTNNGPRNAIQISGSFASDNLILVNGVVIQENLRGQTHGLFIEDAIQETTVITGAVSAEYGRFTGGVVSSVSKSGGNEFSGSFRDTFTNPSWTDKTDFPGDVKKDSVNNEVYEATLGGRIIRDRLWFFGAARQFETTAFGGNFNGGGPAFYVVSEQLRYEAKLTGQVTPKHSLMASFLDSPLTATNNNQLGVWEPSGIDPEIEQANDFKTAHYSGIFTNNFLTEVSYSKKTFTFVGFGGSDTNVFTGTPLIATLPNRGVANHQYFCGICDDEARDNEAWGVKSTYYLSTRGLGTHNLVAGYDNWYETRLSNNYQSSTNLTVWLYGAGAVRNPATGAVTYTLLSGIDQIEYYPVEFPSLGSDLSTDSIYVNDKWDLNNHWSFNLGLRYDKNDASDSFGTQTSNDAAVSPRLSGNYDVFGDGRYRLTAGYSTYVGRLAEAVQGASSPAGSPYYYAYIYGGDDFTGNAADVVRTAITWFQANGGTSRDADFFDIGGFSTHLDGTIVAPSVEEFTIGGGAQIGNNGYVRLDYVDRDWRDYYVSLTNRETGIVTQPDTGARADLTLVSNTDLFDRKYQAVQMSSQYRINPRINIGVNYTLSELTGNAEGENTGSGPIRTGGWIFQYPEYQGFDQNAPTGFLSGDQKHKLRAYVSWDLPLGPVGNLNTSALYNFNSGVPYSASGLIDVRASGVTNPGYVTPPTSETYFFSERGAFRWEDVTSLDLALNWNLPISKIQLYVNAEMFNALNEQAVTGKARDGVTPAVNTTVRTHRTAGSCPAQTGGRCLAFNPFTATPVEGVNYTLHPSFGTPTGPDAFQNPRSYQVSLGLRF